MSDEIRRAVEKVEKLVRLLASDLGDVKRDVGEIKRRSNAHEKLIERLIEDRKETDAALREMAASQSSMASAVSQALV